MNRYYSNYVKTLHDYLRAVVATDLTGAIVDTEEALKRLCLLSDRVAQTKGKQILCGNGASAAFSNHMALDWSKNGRVRSISFSDSALLTALANDLGYEEVFSTPIDWYADADDLLIAITSSGNSVNMAKAIEAARLKGLPVVTFTGLAPDNTCRRLGDINLYIPARTYGIVECAHQILLHAWLDKYMGVTEWCREGYQNMNRNSFSL